MRTYRIGSLQCAVGVFCVVVGVMVLVATHQFNAPAFAPLQPYRLWVGSWATLSGLALPAVAALQAGRALTLAAHFAAALAILALTWGAVQAGALGSVSVDVVLGWSVLIAPWLPRPA